MSSETATTAATPAKEEIVLPEIPPISISRNGQSFEFVIQAETKGKKSEDVLPFFMCFDMEQLPDFDTFRGFVNNDGWFLKSAIIKFKKLCKDKFNALYKQATGADGVFDVNTFTNLFTAAMTELQFHYEKIKELRAKVTALMLQATTLAATGDPSKFDELKEVLSQVAVLNKAIEDRSGTAATGDEEGEEEDNNEAKAA